MYHLRYIAVRSGVVCNKGCGFGLWGRINPDDKFPNYINHLSNAMKQVEEVSKDHTIYRSVISLDEETATLKGYLERKDWERLINKHVKDVAKENHIDIKDIHWLASYHHEKGHPHVHLMFWDNSNRIHNEHMPKEQFEIAMEKIRVSFNRDIFKEELQELRKEQDLTKEVLRNLMKENITGMEQSIFYTPTNERVTFYPKELPEEVSQQLASQFEQLLYSLPTNGQLAYQYLSPNNKQLLNEITKTVIEQTTLTKPYQEYLATVKEIAETYGNSDTAVLRQLEIQTKKIQKDLGNDVLKAVKESGWLERREPQRHYELLRQVDEKVALLSHAVLQEQLQNTDFLEPYQNTVNLMPQFFTPKYEVLKDERIAESLHSLTKQCIDSNPELRKEINTSKDISKALGTEENTCYKATYNYLHSSLYHQAEQMKGYDLQMQMHNVNNFLFSFCKLCSSNQGGKLGRNGAWLFKRELSKQSKKEFAREHQDTNELWNEHSFF